MRRPCFIYLTGGIVAFIGSLFAFDVLRIPESKDDNPFVSLQKSIGEMEVWVLPGASGQETHGSAESEHGSGTFDSPEGEHGTSFQMGSPSTKPLSDSDLDGKGIKERLSLKHLGKEHEESYYRYGPVNSEVVVICAHGANSDTYKEWIKIAEPLNKVHPEWKILVIHLSRSHELGAAINALVSKHSRAPTKDIIIAGKSAGGASVIQYLHDTHVNPYLKGVILAAPASNALSEESLAESINAEMRKKTLVLWMEGDPSIGKAEMYLKLGISLKLYPEGGHYVPPQSVGDIRKFIERMIA